MKILNFGSCNIDYVYRLHHIAAPGETQKSDDLQTFAGGKGLNQSVAIAKAGGKRGRYRPAAAHAAKKRTCDDSGQRDGRECDYCLSGNQRHDSGGLCGRRPLPFFKGRYFGAAKRD